MLDINSGIIHCRISSGTHPSSSVSERDRGSGRADDQRQGRAGGAGHGLLSEACRLAERQSG